MKPNMATIPRGTAWLFELEPPTSYTGAESLRLVVGYNDDGATGDLVKTLTWDGEELFTCTLTAADTQSLVAGRVYRAVVWRINVGQESVPVLDGQFRIVDTPRHV